LPADEPAGVVCGDAFRLAAEATRFRRGAVRAPVELELDELADERLDPLMDDSGYVGAALLEQGADDFLDGRRRCSDHITEFDAPAPRLHGAACGTDFSRGPTPRRSAWSR
jgi:hypothetical protein